MISILCGVVANLLALPRGPATQRGNAFAVDVKLDKHFNAWILYS